MSEQAPAPGWWQASDGKWYPPEARQGDAGGAGPAPGWWQASDGKWYPPEARQQATPPPGWWQASDGKWYPPEARPTSTAPAGGGAASPAPAPAGGPGPGGGQPTGPRGDPGRPPVASAPPSPSAARMQPGAEPEVWSVPAPATAATLTADGAPAAAEAATDGVDEVATDQVDDAPLVVDDQPTVVDGPDRLAAEAPDQPGAAEEPAPADGPEEPATSEAPEEPAATDAPEEPATSEAPEEPATSDAPEEPAATDAPEEPEEPAAADAPGTAEEPAASEAPGTAEEPAAADAPVPARDEVAAPTGAAAPATKKKKVVKKVVKKVSKRAAPAASAPGGSDRPAARPATRPAASGATEATAPRGPTTRRQDLDDQDGPASSAVARTPEEQIAVRDESSRRDRQHLAAARAQAASRALGTLQAQIAAELGDRPTATIEPPAPEPAPAAEADEATPAPPDAPDAPEAPARADEAERDFSRSPARAATGDEPLLSVRPSAVSADLDRIGERLLIFEDRVELRDRLGRVRRTIPGDQIADVVLAKRFTGHMLTVEAGDGSTIQMKGLRPDQAEELRDVIMQRTRRAGPVPDRDARRGRPALAVDHDDLLDKLEALHRAGVLTDDELAAKRATVERMAAEGDESALSATPS